MTPDLKVLSYNPAGGMNNSAHDYMAFFGGGVGGGVLGFTDLRNIYLTDMLVVQYPGEILMLLGLSLRNMMMVI